MDMDAVHVAGLVSLLARLVRACVELVVSGLLREIMVSGRAWWLGCAWVLVYICTELMKEEPRGPAENM